MRKISKKISCTIMILTILVSSFSMGFVSRADTLVGSGSLTFASGSPEYISKLDDINSCEYYYEPTTQSIYTNISLDYGKYYRVFFDWNLSVSLSASQYMTERTVKYMTFGGEKFYFDGNYCTVILPGNGTQGFGLGLESTITIRSNYISATGSYSAVQGYATYRGACNVSVFELSDAEASKYLGIDDIEKALSEQLVVQQKIYDAQEESNTWLEKIWTSIQRFFKGDNAEDDAKVEEFGNETTSQSNKINDLNQQNKVEKVDPSGASSNVDSHIDTEAIGNYGTVLSVFTGNTHILQYILIVLAVALIAYVLFGKR